MSPVITTSSADRWIRWTTTSSVVLVAGIAAVVSYQHMHELALRHGESRLGATLVPLAVDGMIVASSMSILLASRYGRRGGALAWILLIVGSLASLGANVAVADPTTIARIIAAWPSLALIGAYEMLMGQIRQSRTIGTSGAMELELIDEVGFHAEEGRFVRDPENEAAEVRGRGELQRSAWEWAVANSRPDGTLPAGRMIAAQFSRSPRWGRWVKKLGAAGTFE